jgi:hypothetical protein
MLSPTSVEEALKAVIEHGDSSRGLLVFVSFVGLTTLLVCFVRFMHWLVKGEYKPNQTCNQSEYKNNADIHLSSINDSYQIIFH